MKDSPVAKQRETDSLKALDEDDLDPLLETDDVFLESLLEEVQVPPSNPGQPQQKQQTEFQTPQKQPTTTRPDQEVEIAGGGGDDLPFTPDPDVLHLLEEIEREELSPPARMPGKEDDSDDSDGEVMTVEVDRVLARAYDEARQLDEDEAPVEGDSKAPTRPAVVRVVSASAPAAVKDLAAAEPKTGTDDDDPFHLPAVPSSPPPGTAGASPASATAAQSSLTSTADDSTIASRLAALRLPPSPPLQPPATTSATDPFASLPSAPTAIPDSTAKKSPPLDALLPSAPSFAPESRRWRRLVGRQGYTDADAATWCVVCLELATVKCEGCDGDVYCSRCWKEMHASDRAGFDERGHKGVVFVRG